MILTTHSDYSVNNMKRLVFAMKIGRVLDCEVRIIRGVTPSPLKKILSHWTDSTENSVLRTAIEGCEQIQVCLKWGGGNSRYFT